MSTAPWLLYTVTTVQAYTSCQKFGVTQHPGTLQAYSACRWQADKEQELQAAQQEVVTLRARVKQLESDTHSSSSLELKNLSLQQVYC